MKRIIAMLLTVMLICSAAGCSSDKEKKTTAGEIVDHGDYDVIDASKLPSKLDLRNHNGKNYVTPVKTQLFGDCWAFALSGAAEVAYLYANDLGVPAGQVNDKVDFSEKYIAWYMYHGITKDDVVTGKVRESQVGDGFDLSAAEERIEVAAYIIGGPNIVSANLFGAGFGPVNESVTVKGETPYAYDDESSVEWKLPLTAEYRNAAATGALKNSTILPCPNTVDASGNYQYNEDAVTAIKWELYQGHGVSIGVKMLHPGFDPQKRTAYYQGSESPDHAVVVVGYDDDYPKENFTRKAYDGKDLEGSTPPANGAFIIKNSGGLLGDGKADDGFLYLSYYDNSIDAPLSYAFDGKDAHTESNYDQYDLMMTKWYANKEYDSETKMANVFDAEKDEELYRIAYVTSEEKTEVTYEIYKDVEDGDPASGELLEKGVCRHSLPGYHTVDLDGEYAMKKGDKFAVVLTMKRGGESAYTEIVPYSTPFFDGMTVKGVINKGESYLYTDGKWTDMTEKKDDLIELAFKQCSEECKAQRYDTGIDADSKDTFAVDNYPIKAISY